LWGVVFPGGQRASAAPSSITGLDLGGPTLGKSDADEPVSTQVGLNVAGIQPGQSFKLGVLLRFQEGYHSQSNKPAEEGLVPTTVSMDPVSGLTFGEPIYPPGVVTNEPPLGLQNSYYDRTLIVIPVTASPDFAARDVTLTGSLRIQVCDENTCLPPTKLPIKVSAKVLSANEPVAAANADIFGGAAPTTAPAKKSRAADLSFGDENSLSGYSLPAVFGIAFVVGLLFNVVPCVLPVLPLKAVGFYETAQHNRARSVTYGVVFGVGVTAAFAVLGLFVVVFKAFAWGELFSNPWFSGTLAVILLAMAANMFGLFTVNLPAGAYAFSPRHDTYFGNFLFGILTAALSTPCTFGLFVGVLGVALVQPKLIGLLLVCSVGVGMAAPYVALSAMPELARKFPRTGPWAELVKQFMGFLLLGVAIFFAQGWIGRYIGTHNIWWLIFAVLAAGCLFLVFKSLKFGKTARAPVVATVIALLLLAPGLYFARQMSVKPYTWQAYSPQSLQDARATNKVVLVEFTASWCTNCHALEAFVLNSLSVQRAVRDHQVVMIKADLSDTEAPGWNLLKNDLKAKGVPLTVIYSPDFDEPILLPGIYQQGELRKAIELAAGEKKTTAMR
jgi:thiol:disulfide interchange protein DsbD